MQATKTCWPSKISCLIWILPKKAGIDAAREPADDRAVAHLTLDRLDGLLDERAGRPVGLAPCDLEEERAKHLHAARRVSDLRVKLDAEDAALDVGDGASVARFAAALGDLRVDVEVCVRALRNLIDNATRHAPAHSAIELTVVAAEARLRFEIQDRGPGFQGVDPTELFQPFRRGAAKRRGTGLGLAIVDRALRAHGGRVQASERTGGGARFVVELPMEAWAGGRP